METSSSPRAIYLEYLEQVLGLTHVVEGRHIAEAPEKLLSGWAQTRTGHWPAAGAIDLLVVSETTGLFPENCEELWSNMKKAMKLQGRQVLETETDSKDFEGVTLQILEAYPAAVTLILSREPRRSTELRVLGSSKVLESFAPDFCSKAQI